jgi:hypothetical protein
MPATEVIAHLGPTDPVLLANLKEAFSAARRKVLLAPRQEPDTAPQRPHAVVRVSVRENLIYLPLAVVSMFFRKLELDAILNRLEILRGRTARLSSVIEALVAHRCLEPASKLAFQRWIAKTASIEALGVAEERLNNTRAPRAGRVGAGR